MKTNTFLVFAAAFAAAIHSNAQIITNGSGSPQRGLGFTTWRAYVPRHGLLKSFFSNGAKAMTLRPRMLVVLVSALLLVVIPYSQAQEIKLVSPQAYENTEGETGIGEGSFSPFRYQQAFPAGDFAALGGQPHWITSFTVRPDQSLTSPRTVTFPDHQIRLSTTTRSPENLSSRFDDNFGADVAQVYRGPVTLVVDADSLTTVPRKFYQTSYPQEPFLYDPSQGNLLFDVIAWEGASPSTVEDKTTSLTTGLFASSPTATVGQPVVAGIYQFTFVPVPAVSFAAWAACSGLSGTAAAADADPDSDGMPNGVEYILGGNPTVPGTSGSLTATTSGGNIILTFPRDDASETPDVTLTAEAGTDLTSWPAVFSIGPNTAASGPGVSITENGTAPDTITVTIPQGKATRIFARMKVTIVP